MTPDACVMVKRSDEPWCDDVAASLKFFKCGANHQRFATGEAGLGPAGDENHFTTSCSDLGAEDVERAYSDSESGGEEEEEPEEPEIGEAHVDITCDGRVANVQARAPSGTYTIARNDYFTMTDARDAAGGWTDIKIRIHPRLCVAGELERTPQMSKAVTVSDYDDDHDGAPVRSMLVLRAWMLWRATQHGWHNNHPARIEWHAREAEQLRNDVVACGSADGHVLSTGSTKADASIREFWPDALIQ